MRVARLLLLQLQQQNSVISMVFPSNIQTQLNAKAPIDSPTFTGTPSAPTAAAGTETTQVATTEFVQNAVNSLMDAKDALRFIGTLAPDDTLPAADAGHVYRVTGDGTISGLTVHENDTLTLLCR